MLDRVTKHLAVVSTLSVAAFLGCEAKNPTPTDGKPDNGAAGANPDPNTQADTSGFGFSNPFADIDLSNPDFNKLSGNFEKSWTELSDRGQALADEALADLNKRIRDPELAEDINATVHRLGQHLERLEDDPTTGPSGEKFAKNFIANRIPGLSSANRYADSRAIYRYALSEECPEDQQALLLQDAKRKCLYTSMRLGMDVALLGLPDTLDVPIEVAEHLLDAAKYSQLVGELAGQSGIVKIPWTDIKVEDLAILNPILDKMLDYPGVDPAMVTLLEFNFEEFDFQRDILRDDPRPE
ncbi:MAG: hypothetical protein KDD62_03305 [Bdellovibrionales bacterium]|nr:hypothetical protein [Bdellovibrionales bacterium]